LPPKVFETLLALVEKSGHIVERDKLMSEVWKDTFVEEANLSVNLSVNLSALRKTLGKNDQGNDFIETVPRRGYRFRALVSGTFDESDQDETLVIHRRPQARIVKTEIKNEIERGVETPQSLAATNSPIKSLAVLSFRLIKTEEGDEYPSLSLADVLITQLSNIRTIVVSPTSAVNQYADQNSLEAGFALRVDAVLECSIYRGGNKLRVTAIMLETESEIPLWSDKFDIDYKDILSCRTLSLNKR
jgi:DNA-binding winged helix-turn-helix (wHTH) protein